MPRDRFDGRFVVKRRDEVRDEWLRDYRFRQPEADISKDSTLWLEASASADASMPLYANVRRIANAIDLDSAVKEQLDAIGEDEGVPRRSATTSQGFVRVSASVGGGQILQGAILRHIVTRARYQVLVTATYANNAPVPVASVDTGTETILQPGTVLEFENPPVGIGKNAIVDHLGISGGGPTEDDDTYRERIRDGRQHPPAAANWAHYARTVESVGGVAVEKAFIYPAIRGPGTVCVAFTMRAPSLGASRAPNGAQIGEVEAATMAEMPFDDGALFGALLQHGVGVSLGATWAPTAGGWVDAAPWPSAADPAFVVMDTPEPTATSAVVGSGLIPPVNEPQVGKTIALWDAATRRFVPKRIVSVHHYAFTNNYLLGFDTASPTSDTTYVAKVGDRVSPWAAAMNDVVQPILRYFAQQGPGEQVSPLPDVNGRRRRHPESPASWPHVITSRITDGVDDLPSVSSVSVRAPSLPFPTTVGSPGVHSYLHTLTELSVFPE